MSKAVSIYRDNRCWTRSDCEDNKTFLIENFRRYTENHFGRDIDRSGYFTYASLLEDGKLNLDAVEKLLVESEEYQNQTDVESS